MFRSDDPGEQVTVQLDRVGVFSAAKIMAVMYGGMATVMFALFGVLQAAMFFDSIASGDNRAVWGALGTAGVMVAGPMVYAVFAALMGAMMAALYNFMAARIGGLRMSVSRQLLAPE